MTKFSLFNLLSPFSPETLVAGLMNPSFETERLDETMERAADIDTRTLDRAPKPEPRATFKIAQDLTQTAIDKLAVRKKELEATIATASAELAHTVTTLEALEQAKQAYREGNTVAAAQSMGRLQRHAPGTPNHAPVIQDYSAELQPIADSPFSVEDLVTQDALTTFKIYDPAMDATLRHPHRPVTTGSGAAAKPLKR